MAWLPSEPVLLDVLDTESGISALLYYDDPEASIEQYQYEFSPIEPVLFDVVVSTPGVEVSAETLSGTFVPEYIEYRDGDDVVRVSDWPQLPPDKDIIEFRPSSITQFTFEITVTVSGTKTDEIGLAADFSSSNTWQVIVRHDYSSGRDQLLEYMNASSHTAG